MKLRNKRTGGLANCEPIEVSTDAGFHDYYSLAELNEEWEDAEGINARSMPLIKDEKIRKAVRAWADINEYKKCLVRVYDYDRMGICIPEGVTSFVSCDTQLGITFFEVDLDIKTETVYTIGELCGEEEE